MYAIKVELKLNNKERTLMRQHAGFSRLVYNYGLSLMLGSKDIKYPTGKKIDTIQKVLTNYTKKQPENTWMINMSSRVYSKAFNALKNAYSRWRQGTGKKPVFKRKKDGDSFTVDSSNGVVLLDAGKKIKIPTLGSFRLKEKLECRYVTQTFTISRQADKWYVSFAVKADRVPPLMHEVKGITGIDLGVKCFATLSDGTQIEAPKPYKQAKTKLAKFQWRNRNKVLGNRRLGIKQSKNADKFYRKLARKHANISNQRLDFLHKTTTHLTQKYSHLVIEDLNVSGMIANHKLSAAISDLGFYEFRRQLEYKSVFYGGHLTIVDRWYPSSKTCAKCSHIQAMPLSQRMFECSSSDCNWQTDRDLNAAINLTQAPPKQRKDLVYGWLVRNYACGQEGADTLGRNRN